MSHINRNAASPYEQRALEEAEQRGFKAKTVGKSGKKLVGKTVTRRGAEYEEVKLAKNDDEHFGKIPKVVAYGLVGMARTAITLGLHTRYRENTFKAAKEAYHDSKEPPIGLKSARAVATVAAGVSTLGTAFAFKNVRDETWSPVMNGQAEETVWVKKAAVEEDTSHLGYKVKDRADVRRYAEGLAANGSPRVRQMGAHMVIQENRRSGKSAFIFIPNGNFAEAKSVKYWKAKDGSAVTDPHEQWKAIQKYCAAIDQVEKDFDKEATEMAKHLGEIKNDQRDQPKYDLEDPKDIEKLKTKIKKRVRTIVLGDDHARFYGKVDPNKTNTGSFLTGTRVAYSKDVSKTVSEINGNKQEHKPDIRGDTPYKGQSKPESQPVPISDYTQSDYAEEMRSDEKNRKD